MKEIVVRVKGMVCNGCEKRVINALKNIDGVKNVKADHKIEKVIVTSNDNVLESEIKDKIKNLGFKVVTED